MFIVILSESVNSGFNAPPTHRSDRDRIYLKAYKKDQAPAQLSMKFYMHISI